MNEKVSNLLLMVKFLHGMLDDFKRFQPTLEKIEQLNKELWGIDRSNFHRRKCHEQIKREILELAKPIEQAITEPIKQKVAELKLCDWNDDTTLWGWNIGAVEDFKREAQENDATLIVDNYRLYEQFKSTATPPPFTYGFFSELDKFLNEFYSYFIPKAEQKSKIKNDVVGINPELINNILGVLEGEKDDTPTTTERPQLPKEWLKKFYEEFREYFNFENEAEFIAYVQGWKSLRGKFNRKTQSTFGYYIQRMIEQAEKLEIIPKGVKTTMMESFGFGRKIDVSKVSKQPDRLTLVAKLDDFLAKKCT